MPSMAITRSARRRPAQRAGRRSTRTPPTARGRSAPITRRPHRRSGRCRTPRRRGRPGAARRDASLPRRACRARGRRAPSDAASRWSGLVPGVSASTLVTSVSSPSEHRGSGTAITPVCNRERRASTDRDEHTFDLTISDDDEPDEPERRRSAGPRRRRRGAGGRARRAAGSRATASPPSDVGERQRAPRQHPHRPRRRRGTQRDRHERRLPSTCDT